MANIKVFHRIRVMLCTRNWLKAILGNILSTMMGIILTIGIGALVEYHKDKELARNMMFNVVSATVDNRMTIEKYDSVFKKQIKSIDSLVSYYNKGTLDKVPEDTLYKHLNVLKQYSMFSRKAPEIYINNARTIQQFGNTDVYEDFQEFVQIDRLTFSDIVDITSDWKEFSSTVYSKMKVGHDKPAIIVRELIESNTLTNYEWKLQLMMLPEIEDMYRNFFKQLLKIMQATEEEYNNYLKSNEDGIKDYIVVKENL